MKNLIALFSLLAIVNVSKGQNQKITLSPDDIRDFKNRTLVVELLEEEPALLKRYEKQSTKNPDKLENYQTFIEKYNEYIQSAFNKHWTLNSKIIFKSSTEIKQLMGEKSAEHMILRFDNFGGGAYYTRRSFMLHKGEKTMHSYLFWLPVEFDEDEVQNLYPYTVAVVIQFIQRHLDAIAQSDDNKLEVEDFFVQQSAANCSKMRANSLLIPKHTIHNNVEVNVLRGMIGQNCEILPDSYVQKAYAENKPGSMIPVTFFVGNTDRVNVKRVIIGLDGIPYSIVDPAAAQANRFTFDGNDIGKLYKCE